MIKKLISFLPLRTAYAHCDIPCGIYDPQQAQTAAHTVIRMVNLITDLKEDDPKELAFKMSRYGRVKDEHAEIVKHEVRVIWGDYFKEENSKEIGPEKLAELVDKIMKLASKARQEIDLEVANNLLSAVQEFAEIFYQSKGLTPVRVKSPYPTGGELVIYK